MNRRWILLGLVAALTAPFAAADDGWAFSFGGGVLHEPVYEGSADTYRTPVPAARVEYTAGALSLSASLLDGLGVSYIHERSGVLGSIGVVPGPERNPDGYAPLFTEIDHSAETRRLLAGTPTVRSPVEADLMVGAVTPVGVVGATLGYRPIRGDRNEEAFVGSALYMIPVPVTDRFAVMGLVGVEVMDGAYADAWYGLEEDTAALRAYDPAAGLRAAQLVLELTYRITERLGVSLLGRELVLLGDAAKSPFTERRFQTTAFLQAYYTF